MKHLYVTFAMVILTIGVPLYAHHSFAAYYFESQSMSIEGEIVEFEYKNPHAWVHVSATDSIGQIQEFSAEWSNPNRLKQQNITKDTLKIGDYVIVTGAPGRKTSDRVLHLKAIQRPADGWMWGGGRR